MSNYLFKDRDGQTPLPPELRKGLIPKNVQNMGELDEYEEENITEGIPWLEKQNGEYRTYNFWQKLHKKLFGKVWKWAGQVRTHELQNPDFHLPQNIWPAFKQLEDDLSFWLSEGKMSDGEIAARFHERLLTIHPFPNGNGRFARILTEHLCKQESFPIPQWGVSLRKDPKIRREKYVESLTAARRTGNHKALLDFMYS